VNSQNRLELLPRPNHSYLLDSYFLDLINIHKFASPAISLSPQLTKISFVYTMSLPKTTCYASLYLQWHLRHCSVKIAVLNLWSIMVFGCSFVFVNHGKNKLEVIHISYK